jgi:hypothetical protein
MAHCVTGLIATTALLETFARERGLHAPIRLSQGLGLLPLRDTDLDKFLVAPLTGHAAPTSIVSLDATATVATRPRSTP